MNKLFLVIVLVAWSFVAGYKTGRGDSYDNRAQVHAAQNETKMQAELLQQCRNK